MRPDHRQQKMKTHHVDEWDQPTACGRESIDLNQALDWDLTDCERCLRRKVKG